MATFATNFISCSGENVKALSWGYRGAEFLPIVPQLSKCLKFEAILGDQTDQRICI